MSRAIQQGELVYVYLLWCSDGKRLVLLDVYTHKTQAEADLRVLRDDNYEGFEYRITERKTVPHNSNH